MVVLLLPPSLAIYDGEFDHGGGGEGSGGLVAAAGVLVVVVDDNWQQEAAGNESVHGCMTACDDKNGRWTIMQQPTIDGSSKNGQWWWW